MAAQLVWQRSLRGGSMKDSGRMATRKPSLGNANDKASRLMRRRSSLPGSDLMAKENEGSAYAGPTVDVVKSRKLSVISDNSGDEREKIQRRQRVQHKPHKKTAAAAAAAAGNVTRLFELCPEPLYRRDRLVSPIPLPRDVECIDPDGESLFKYWPDFIQHCRNTEKAWIFSADQILGSKKELATNRSLLIDWILEITVYYKVSQETLYHTVRFVDATLARHLVKNSNLQLMAISSFLIAAKLEEYYPPSIESLIYLTGNSYTANQVLVMERVLLKKHGFVSYAPEPMLFLNRYVRAAFKEDDSIFMHVCLFFIDCITTKIYYSSYSSSLKAAAAVYASMTIVGNTGRSMWTPTLEYYTGYREDEIKPLAQRMASVGLEVLKALNRNEDTDDSFKFKGIVRKFSSVSRHAGLLQRPEFVLERYERLAEKLLMKQFPQHDPDEDETEDVFV